MISRLRTLLTLIVVVPLSAAMVSCASPGAAFPPMPARLSPSAVPTLSDDEALQAAMSVFAQWSYLMNSTHSLDSQPFRKMKSVTTDEYFRMLSSDGSFEEMEYYSRGIGKLKNASLVDVERGDDFLTVQVAACIDVSSLVFLNHDGEDITDDIQQTQTVPSTAIVVWNSEESRFLIDQWGPWHDDSICDDRVA